MLSNRVFNSLKTEIGENFNEINYINKSNIEKIMHSTNNKIQISFKKSDIEKSGGKITENGKVSQANTVSVTDLGKMLLNSCRDGDTTKVHELMCRGAPFTTDWLGTSPIHLAAMNNHIETCEILLRAGMSKDAKTKVDRTPLHFAVFEGHVKMVELLLINKCEVDSKDMLKMTPLHWAVQRKFKSIVELLLQYNADPNVVSKFGKTPLIIAYETGQEDVIKLLEVAITNRMENPQQTQEATEQLVYEMKQQQCISDSDSESIPQLSSIKIDNNYQQIFNIVNSDSVAETIVSGNADLDQIDDSNIIEDTMDDDRSDSPNLSEAITQLQNIDDTKTIDESTLQMLKEHGISMIQSDESDISLITSAMQSGRKLVLSEAGKLLLNDPKFKKQYTETTISNQTQPPPLIESEQQKPINSTSLPINSTSKNIPVKTNKVIKILSAEQFKQMCGGDLSNAIKITPQESLNKNQEGRNIPNRIPTIFQLNNQKVNRPVMSKNKINFSPSVKNITFKTINSHQSSSTAHQLVSPTSLKDGTNIIQSAPSSLSIKREIIPTSKILSNNSSSSKNSSSNNLNNNKVIITPLTQSTSSAQSVPLTNSTKHSTSLAEMEKQILELKKITEDLRKQFDLSQKENEELRLRLDRLEKERDLDIM